MLVGLRRREMAVEVSSQLDEHLRPPDGPHRFGRTTHKWRNSEGPAPLRGGPIEPRVGAYVAAAKPVAPRLQAPCAAVIAAAASAPVYGVLRPPVALSYRKAFLLLELLVTMQ